MDCIKNPPYSCRAHLPILSTFPGTIIQDSMSASKKEHQNFFVSLFKQALPSILVVFLCSILYYYYLPQEPETDWLLTLVMSLAFIKAGVIAYFVFHRLGNILGEGHYLIHILVLFGLVIGLNIFTFTSDFFGLYLLDPGHFDIKNFEPHSRFHIYYQSFYGSVVAYSTIGFGDMVPASVYAKLILMLEVFMYFYVILFGTANINKIEIKD